MFPDDLSSATSKEAKFSVNDSGTCTFPCIEHDSFYGNQISTFYIWSSLENIIR